MTLPAELQQAAQAYQGPSKAQFECCSAADLRVPVAPVMPSAGVAIAVVAAHVAVSVCQAIVLASVHCQKRYPRLLLFQPGSQFASELISKEVVDTDMGNVGVPPQ